MAISLLSLNIWKSGTGSLESAEKDPATIKGILERIADTIKKEGVNIVALQEVDRNARRSGGLNGDEIIYNRLGPDWQSRFATACNIPAAAAKGEGLYGNAILTNLKIKKCIREKLGRVEEKEDRSAIAVKVAFPGRSVFVINLHLGLQQTDQRSQLSKLVSLIKEVDQMAHIILCGDFNIPEVCLARDNHLLKYNQLLPILSNSSRTFVDLGPSGKATCHGKKIDYIFLSVGRGLELSQHEVEVIDFKGLSDHHGIKAKITFKNKEERHAGQTAVVADAPLSAVSIEAATEHV